MPLNHVEIATEVPLKTTEILRDLWRRRLDTLISGIANGDPYYQQIANAAEHVSAEYQGRFLIELIQNANDQAVRHGLKDSSVTITRTETLIAVGNSGQPFDREKVDAVTSIFKSDKTADECIGNKGIGFKAVFQIASSAEVFSCAPDSNLAEGCAIAFRMVRRPFEDPLFFDEIRSLAAELLDRHPDRRTEIEERFPGDDAVNVTLREAQRAAWFTFPLPAAERHYQDRMAELGLDNETQSLTQTLIVLPTDGADTTIDRISAAIDEVQGGGSPTGRIPPASSFLFLPGIAGIDVIDRARGFRSELKKCDTSAKTTLQDDIIIRRQRTTRSQFDLSAPQSSPESTYQDWWVAERTLGRETADHEGAESERQAIREAISALHLPEENWKEVEHVPVAVALPDPMRGDMDDPTAIGANGRFCIGLPTQVDTGVPMWVSSHFHGKIDRTSIEFGNAYNKLLFSTAVDLAAVMIERLKQDPKIATKRLATLAMQRASGVLADAFYEEGGLARSDIVLGTDGTFFKASELKLPKSADLSMFGDIAEGVSDLKQYGFILPDWPLLSSAREVLDDLAVNTDVADSRYLHRPAGLPSLLEHAAQSRRGSGPTFWEPFLTWILDRFSVHHSEALETQLIVPTGSTDLSSPSMRVFFRPVSVAGRGVDDKGTVDDAGDELAIIDDTVASLLKFFDDNAINVRTGTARDYTSLAQRIAPNAGGGLVRRPRQADLINDALIPALKGATDNNERALALLRQALVWLVGMPQKSRNRVSADELLVPVCGQGNAWEWVEPETAYLGMGWDSDPNIRLLTEAYGSRPCSQLIPWDRFERKAIQLFRAAERQWWLDRLKEIGVWDCPRIIRSERRIGVAQSDSYSSLTPWTWVNCPTSCPKEIWEGYLRRICRRNANTKSGQEFYLKEVCWIDGLESDEIRATVAEAMLRKPDRYEAAAKTRLARWGGEDSSDVDALWTHALLAKSWQVVPTSMGLRGPNAAWFVPLETRSTKADRFAFLSCVKSEFSAARRLLSLIGVITLEEATIPRLIAALHELSERIIDAEPEQLRHISALATDLYEAIQARLRSGESSDSLKTLLNAPVPLLRNDDIDSVELANVERILLDDDAIRRRYVRGFEHSWMIPKRFHQSYNELIDALRDLLGAENVVRISECEIDVQFEPFEQGIALLDYMTNEFPHQSVSEDLGLLIVKGGTQFTSPHEETFRQTWNRFTRTKIVRGEFMGDTRVACFDAQHTTGPRLMVASKLKRHEVVGEMWQLVGPAYRDIWSAYAQSLLDGRSDRFFEERGVSATERTEVEVAIGLGFEQRLRRYQPVCLAAWRRANSGRSTDEFHKEWAKNARMAEAASKWLAWTDLVNQVELITREDEPHGSLMLLRSFGIPVEEWQSARRELGAMPWRFVESLRLYESARNAIVGHLMAWFAYLVVPRATGRSGPTASLELAGAVQRWVDQVRELSAPDHVAEADLDAPFVISNAARSVAQIGATLPEVLGEPLLSEALQTVIESAPTEVASIKLKSENDKAATIYERDDPTRRQQQAASAVDAVVKVAGPLAGKNGEALDESSIRNDELVSLLCQGVWANRVSVLAAVRYALERATPKTASRMKERQAFRDFDDWRALWGKFDELGEIPRPPAPSPPKPRFDVLGSGWTEDDFDASAAEGPGGEVARRLEEAVIPELDLAALRDLRRNKVEAKIKRPRRGTGGKGIKKKRVPDKYLSILGAVGEYFAYQQFKVLCPDFDIAAWRSTGREFFGYDPGDDSLGYDFEYWDVAGKLTGKAESPRCLIEVKSAAHDCGDSFDMSINEWEIARSCHEQPENGIYIVARVANVALAPHVVDLLVDPMDLHLKGLLDFSSRDLLVVVGSRE